MIPNLTLLRQAAVVVAVVWAVAVAPSAIFAADRIQRMGTVIRAAVGACLGFLIFLILIAVFSFPRLSILDMLALAALQWPLTFTSAIFGAITLVLLGAFPVNAVRGAGLGSKRTS